MEIIDFVKIMADIKKDFGRVKLTVKQIEDVAVARKKGDSPALIASKMSLPLVQVRNVVSALVKRGAVFPLIARKQQSKYLEIARKFM